ncbi:phage tail tape measure protein [Campylobacter sp. 7477a]|uniref:phage tail tape measure protein n=1 Tax=Campylobacter sp. 7477a TaxID=2735741 RepID=UPI00301484F3|nr:phage tail tape measure protein [Campylobacter sp. 7477a]
MAKPGVKEPNANQIDDSIYATEAKAGITKLKNSITGNAEDVAVTEKAVKSFLDESFDSSKSSNGYTKLPNGLILQWGITDPQNGFIAKSIMFPIAFTSVCFGVWVTLDKSQLSATTETVVSGHSTTGFLLTASVMNNLKLGIDEIAVLGDKINYLDDKMSMVNARDIINVIGRTAGSGSILGLKGDKISALASSFLSLGKAPEVASTAMNSLFNKLANIDGQDEKFKEALKSMGMDANYLKVAMQRDASGGLDMFLNALAKVDKRAQMGVLTDMFGSQADLNLTGSKRILSQKRANLALAQMIV